MIGDAAPPAPPPLGLPPLPVPPGGAAILPEGSCDCHFHVIAPDMPLVSPRSYTPPAAGLSGWRAMADRVGIARGVIVQPSVYGRDNRVLLAALAEGAGRLRGVAVIDPETPAAELERLDGAGVRGVRINLRNLGGLPLEAIPVLAARIAPLGWHLQFQIGPDQIDDLAQRIEGLPVPAVIDHCAFIATADVAARAAGLVSLQRLLDGPARFIKLSAPYRLAPPPDYAGFGALAAGLAGSHPDRLVWASDWPHTELFDTVPDDMALAEAAMDWIGDDAVRAAVFVETPRRLYWAET